VIEKEPNRLIESLILIVGIDDRSLLTYAFATKPWRNNKSVQAGAQGQRKRTAGKKNWQRKIMSEKSDSKPIVSPPEPLSTGDVPEQTGKEVVVHYRPEPAKPPGVPKIHPRQKIPPVPEGEKIPDQTPSGPVDLE
jgi:hypothetical protein